VAPQGADGPSERPPAGRGAQAVRAHQTQLTLAMGVTSGWASQIERGELAAIDAVARCAEALGGRLDLIASLDDDTLTVATTEAA